MCTHSMFGTGHNVEVLGSFQNLTELQKLFSVVGVVFLFCFFFNLRPAKHKIHLAVKLCCCLSKQENLAREDVVTSASTCFWH